MIEINNLSKSYGKNEVLSGISAHIKKGEIFAFMGHSGAGKSTLLRCINGLESYNSGSLKVLGREIKSLNEQELREMRRDIGMIFQHFALLARKTAFENIALPLRLWGYNESAIKSRVYELLELVGLKDKASFYPNALSGGQKQRIAIARALALNPKILLSDEATSALDPNITKQILELLKQINKELGITIVLVTHEMDAIKSTAGKGILLEAGKIVDSGDIRELFLRPSASMREFLGENEILPQSGVNIRLSFAPDVANKSFISDMSKALNIDINIVWGRIEQYADEVLGSLVVCVSENDKDKVLEFSKKEGVIAQII